MTADARTAAAAPSYGNWRRPASAGVLGLGGFATGILFAGIAASVVAAMVAGLVTASVVAAVFGVLLLVVGVKDRHGRSALTRASDRLLWARAVRSGSTVYRSGPLGAAEWGTFQLPGLAASSRLSEHEDARGRPFALLHVPATRHVSVVLAAEPDGSALVDGEEIDNRVAEYGVWLARLADEPLLEAAAVIVESSPDTGARLRAEVEGSIDPDAPPFALAMLRQVVDDYPVGSATVRSFITLTFSLGRPGSRRRVDEVAHELASRLPGLAAGLAAAGAGAARTLAAAELCELIRSAYDPDAAELIDRARADGDPPELRWTDAGPAAHETRWDSYRHDSAVSCSWTMTSPPRGSVPSGVLGRLLAPHPDIARKRVALLYRPIDPARAAAIVEADLNAATFNATSSARPTARVSRSARSATATAAEEAAGAGLVDFGLVVTATVRAPDRLTEARAAVDSLSSSARLTLRPAYGAQDSAFAAALPLGLVLPRHLRAPTDVGSRR